MRARELSRIEFGRLGLCHRCGDEREDKKFNHCKKCREQINVLGRKYRSERKKANTCMYCGKLPKDAGRACINCWFKQMSWRTTGTATNHLALKTLWEKQGGLCRYTGQSLQAGVNASLDHIIPVSKGGTNEIANLQWVKEQINRMKTDIPHDEFVKLCALIGNAN